MSTVVRRYLGQAAVDVSLELASKVLRNGLSPTDLAPSQPKTTVLPPFTPCLLRNRSVVYLEQPLQPQLAKIDHVYQKGFIGVCQALGAPSGRLVGFINGRCNSPLHFKNHVLRLAAHGVNVIGLYNPCLPTASKVVDYSQALKILWPWTLQSAVTEQIPDFIDLALSLKNSGRFKVLAHSHGYALLAQSLKYHGKFWAEYGKQVELVGFAGVTSIPRVYDLQRINFCNEGDWAVQWMLSVQRCFDDLHPLPKPSEPGPYHGLWGPGYASILKQTILD